MGQPTFMIHSQHVTQQNLSSYFSYFTPMNSTILWNSINKVVTSSSLCLVTVIYVTLGVVCAESVIPRDSFSCSTHFLNNITLCKKQTQNNHNYFKILKTRLSAQSPNRMESVAQATKVLHSPAEKKGGAWCWAPLNSIRSVVWEVRRTHNISEVFVHKNCYIQLISLNI